MKIEKATSDISSRCCWWPFIFVRDLIVAIILFLLIWKIIEPPKMPLFSLIKANLSQ